MPVTSGVGESDLISLSLLVKDLLATLNESQGLSAEYQKLISKLHAVEAALLDVEQLWQSGATNPELAETTQHIVVNCRRSVANFIDFVREYDGIDLGNKLKATSREILWAASQRDTEIAKSRVEATHHVSSLTLILTAAVV